MCEYNIMNCIPLLIRQGSCHDNMFMEKFKMNKKVFIFAILNNFCNDKKIVLFPEITVSENKKKLGHLYKKCVQATFHRILEYF